MKKLFVVLIALFTLLLLPGIATAQESDATPSSDVLIDESQLQQQQAVPQEEFSRAKVIEILEDKNSAVGGFDQPYQKVKLRLETGSEVGKEIEVEHGGLFAIQEEQKVKVGDTVVITKTAGPTGEIYYITDKYRIFPLIVIFAVFFGLAVIFGRVKGASAILGLLASIFVLVKFVVPQILAGANPLTTSLGGALAIAIVSLYMAHGLNRRTTVALAGTVVTLLIAAGLAMLYVSFVGLSGTGSEEAIFLRMGPIGAIDLRGLLLGGIIIGALGVLDDITTAQAATVDELQKANPDMSKGELMKRALSVGREHIASLVNTLALAYAGASFPLLLLFSISQDIPLWLTVNSEFIAEELVRTLVGSTALILAVPISTFLAVNFLASKRPQFAIEVIEEEVVRPRRKRTTTRKASSRKSKRV